MHTGHLHHHDVERIHVGQLGRAEFELAIQIDQRGQFGAQPDHRHTVDLFDARRAAALVVANHLK